MSDKSKEKGIALFMVLATILIVVVLANVIMSIISNQGRLTRHEVGRIQAYYAARSGIVYATAQLSNGNWVYGTNCTDASPCTVTDTGFAPFVINNAVTIIFCPSGSDCGTPNAVHCTAPAGSSFCIESFATYTYTP